MCQGIGKGMESQEFNQRQGVPIFNIRAGCSAECSLKDRVSQVINKRQGDSDILIVNKEKFILRPRVGILYRIRLP